MGDGHAAAGSEPAIGRLIGGSGFTLDLCRLTTEPADSSPTGAVDIQLGPGPVFHPSTLEVPAGDRVTFFLHAPPENQEPHSMAIRMGLDVVARMADAIAAVIDFLARYR